MSISKDPNKTAKASAKAESPKAKGRTNNKVADALITHTPTISISAQAKPVYLTKRILERAARKAFREAAKSSMERMGYVVVEQDGWIIRLFKDGKIEQIEQIQKLDIPFVLD
jgi:hypothetical protein